MKRLALPIMLLAVASIYSYAQPNKLGVGIIVGAPTGLTVKYWNTPREAFQGYLGGGFGGVTIGADIVFHSNAFRRADLPFYFGPGVFLGSSNVGGPRFGSNQVGLGARMIFGADYLFPNDPFDIAIEAGPVLLLSPVVGVGLEAGIAFRFYP